MVFCKNLIVTLVLLISIVGIAFAIVPTTEPCWIKGEVTGSGITVEGLTVGAYNGSTLLKAGTIADGNYSLNSVGANTGDTITLRVYGADFNSLTFEGFCKTGTDPWVVSNFTVSKQANGTTCSNAAICTSGYCSTTCQTTPSTTNPPGGTSSPGGSTPGTSTPTTDVNTVTTESYSTTTVTDSNGVRNALEGSGLTEVEVEAFVAAAAEGNIEIIRELVVTTATSNGTDSYESTFTLVIKNTSEENLEDITIVETIPKEIVQDASEINSIFDFRVLIADPVIEFTILSIPAGETVELTYYIEENVTEEEFNSMPGTLGKGTFAPIGGDDTVVCSTVWEPVCGTNGITYNNSCYAEEEGIAVAYTGECQEVTPTNLEGTDWTVPLTIIGLIVIILIIIGVVIATKKKGKKNKLSFNK